MRNMSNAVKALPDSLAEGMTKVSDNMGRMSERLGQDIKQSILKVTPSNTASILHLTKPSTFAHCSDMLVYPTSDHLVSLLCSPRCLHSSPSLTLTLSTVESPPSLMTM